MADKEAARKDGKPIVISQTPDVCKTPVGGATPPVPYPVTKDLGDALNASPNVNFTGQSAFILTSQTPDTVGDAAGSAAGVKSGTVGAECRAIRGSSTVRVNGLPVIRHGDPFTMNAGNTIGKLVYLEGAGGAPSSDGATTPPDEDEGFFGWVADTLDAAEEMAGEVVDQAQALDEQYAILTRAEGLVQGGFGVVEIVGGAAGIVAPEPATTVGGVVLVANGIDNAGAGFTQLFTGEAQQTLVEQGTAMAAEAAGLDPAKVQMAADVVGMIGSPGKIATKADDVVEGVADIAQSQRRTDTPDTPKKPKTKPANANPGDGTKIVEKPKFVASPKHGTSARQTPKGVSNPNPTNGQHALDNSVQVKGTSPRRIGVDKVSGEIVVFDKTSQGIFHGHVRSFEELTSQQQNVLRKSGMVNHKGKIQ